MGFNIDQQKVMDEVFNEFLNIVPIKDLYSKKEYNKLEVVSVVDKTAVILIEAKSEPAKQLLYPFVSKQSNRCVLDLSYQTTSVYNKCKYGVDYIKYAIELLNASDEEIVEISLKKEYPITLENEHFSIIIAPRVD